MVYYKIERLRFLALPEFILFSIAKRKSRHLEEIFNKIDDDKNFDYKITTFENKNLIKKHINDMLKHKEKIIKISEEILLLTDIAVERRTGKLYKIYIKVKKDKNYFLFKDEIQKCIMKLSGSFKSSLRMVEQYMHGGSYSINISDELVGCHKIIDYIRKLSNRLYHMQFVTSREVKNDYKKLKSLLKQYHSNKQKQTKHNNNIKKTITSLIKKIDVYTKRFESIHHSVLESLLKLEKEYDQEHEKLFSNLDRAIFSEDEIKDLKKNDEKRKKQHKSFLNNEFSHLRTMSKEYCHVK